jgi:hypothetical protein
MKAFENRSVNPLRLQPPALINFKASVIIKCRSNGIFVTLSIRSGRAAGYV